MMFLLLALFGCRPSFDSVEEACDDLGDVPGAKHGSPEAIAYYQRVNCYRRYAQLPRQRISPDVQLAVSNHAEYLSQNYDANDTSLDGWVWTLYDEDPSAPGFTGGDDFARLESAGLSVSASSYGGWWTGWLDRDGSTDYAAIADIEMEHFITRQTILQMDNYSGGLHRTSDGFVWQFELYEYPPSRTSLKPLLWPPDGMVDVPTTSFNGWVIDGFGVPYGEQGYHISAHVPARLAGGSWASNDPFGIVVDDYSLQGPDGEVEMVVVPPSNPDTPGALLYTVGYVPLAPLQPGATYTFETTLTWQKDTTTVSTTFTTANG